MAVVTEPDSDLMVPADSGEDSVEDAAESTDAPDNALAEALTPADNSDGAHDQHYRGAVVPGARRPIMCVRATGCVFLYTSCMVDHHPFCADDGSCAPRQKVDKTVRAQLNNVNMAKFRGAASRRYEVELEHSLNSTVPALASWAEWAAGPA